MFKRNGEKYNAQKITIDWIKFKSKLEARVYNYLKNNWYNVLEIEPVFLLQTKFSFENKNYREIKYKSDFLIEGSNWTKIIIEAKWFETPEWKLKKKLFLYKIKDYEKEYDCSLIFLICKSVKNLKEQLDLLNNK